jgi:hypothetical protein
VTLAILNAIVLLISAGTIVALALLPGHNFGSPLFPVAFTLLDKTVVLPLWQVWLGWWLLANLWFVFAGACMFLFSLVSRNEIVGISLLLLVVFAPQLQILALLPPTLVTYLPANFVVLGSVARHAEAYSALPLVQVVLIFAIWSLVCVGLSAALLRLRDRRLVPLLN